MKTWQIISILFIGFVCIWCVSDWFFVRGTPEVKERMHAFEFLYFLFPISAGAVVFKKGKSSSEIRALLAFATTIGFAALCVFWVLVFGVPFHFWLGGTL